MAWKTIHSESILETPYVVVNKDDVMTDSGIEIKDFYTVWLHDAVGIVALTPDQQIILKKEYRYSQREETTEIPAGMVEKNDSDPLHAARRELLEETGYESDNWTYIGSVAENTSKLTNRAHLYIAENCIKTSEQKTDQTESISIYITDFSEAVEMVMNREIISGITAYGILYAETRNRGIGYNSNR